MEINTIIEAIEFENSEWDEDFEDNESLSSTTRADEIRMQQILEEMHSQHLKLQSGIEHDLATCLSKCCSILFPK
jgi:hypothetical protein